MSLGILFLAAICINQYLENQSIRKHVRILSRVMEKQKALNAGPSAGTKMNPFILQTLDKETIKSTSLDNNYSLLLFFESCCAIDFLQKIDDKLSDNNIKCFAISSQYPDDLKNYANELHNIKLVYDNERELSTKFEVSEYPCAFLINKDGVVEIKEVIEDNKILSKIINRIAEGLI